MFPRVSATKYEDTACLNLPMSYRVMVEFVMLRTVTFVSSTQTLIQVGLTDLVVEILMSFGVLPCQGHARRGKKPHPYEVAIYRCVPCQQT